MQGGHRTSYCFNEYHILLLEQYNIIIIQQMLRLLYTNVIDLGVWAGLKSAVECKYYMQRINQEALVWSVLTIWSKGHIDRMINKGFECLLKVICLINEDRVRNDLVETIRGVKNKDMKFNFDLNTQYYAEYNGVTDKDINNIVNYDDKGET